MPRITHPRPSIGRQHFLGVDFRDGVATVDDLHPERAQALLQHGATIEVDGIALESLSRRELRDIAEVEGITLPPRATKAEILATINQAPLRTLTEFAEPETGTEAYIPLRRSPKPEA